MPSAAAKKTWQVGKFGSSLSLPKTLRVFFWLPPRLLISVRLFRWALSSSVNEDLAQMRAFPVSSGDLTLRRCCASPVAFARERQIHTQNPAAGVPCTEAALRRIRREREREREREKEGEDRESERERERGGIRLATSLPRVRAFTRDPAADLPQPGSALPPGLISP